MALRSTLSLLLVLTSLSLLSQERKHTAVKIDKAPKIDGVLDDAAWQGVPVMTGFIQNYPSYGTKASRESEVRIVYDDEAIYVGAYLFDDPSLIRRQITARDAEQQTDVDFFSVFFDTYNDNQNGFQFLVTSANVQTDARLSPNYSGNFGSYGDKSWDAVWQSRVSIQKDGWVVEMKIPYISLRFAKKDVQDWGLQVLRSIRRTNETCFWNPVDPQVNGFVNQFGLLEKLENITPPLRLSFSPYVTTGYRSSPVVNNYLNEWLRNGGMDVKYGINESFTLDATLIPDFGQVISDNVVNNLTPYEVQFRENRPFFSEGTEMFNKAGLFYSRRIGAIPRKYFSILGMVENDPNLEVVKNPSSTQLYNAFKLSGRTEKKLGIGVFNAVTAPMHAIVRNKINEEESKIQTEPLANYNIFVLDQAFSGRSSVTFTNTNVIRNGANRDANVSAIDFSLFDATKTYRLNGTARYSKIWGTNPYDGFNTSLRFGKVSGNWQYYVDNNIKSKQYDPNDLGILRAPNEVTYRANLSYRMFQPTAKFITYSYSVTPRLQYLYEPYAYNRFDVTANAFWIFRNFWDVSISANMIPGRENNYFELRTDGRYLSYPSNFGMNLSGSTDSRKKLFVRYDFDYAVAPENDNTYAKWELGARFRFSNRFSLDLETESGLELNQLGYAFRRESNGEPIVGFRNNREFVSLLSGIYNFTSRINLTLRARHYWNRVNYLSFHNVTDKGRLTPRPFIPGQDENFNAFNIDAFLTWDFRLGSRLILGYKNWLGDLEEVNLNGRSNYLKNLGEVFALRHGNELTLRFIYFLDYNQFRKNR